MSLSLPVGLYFQRYLYLKISALAHRAPAPVASLVPQILAELHQSGSFRKISLYLWVGHQEEPREFHAGDPLAADELPLRADWSLGPVSVSVFAEPIDITADASLHLLGFVSQQVAQLAHAEALRFANAALEAEIKGISETLALIKLHHRAASLLIDKRRSTAAAA